MRIKASHSPDVNHHEGDTDEKHPESQLRSVHTGVF
jgi:hypothetical protein